KDTNGKHFKAFSFQAEPGKSYKFEMAGQGGLDPEIRIEDANGKQVKNEEFGDGKVSRINSFTVTAAGTFKVIASTFKAGIVGGFTLTASEEGGGAVAGGKGEPLNFAPGKPAVVQGKIAATDPKDANGRQFKT